MKIVYAYNKTTKQYVGGYSEGNPEIPADCDITEVAPEHANSYFVVVENAWHLNEEYALSVAKNTATLARKSYLSATDYKIIKQMEGIEDCPIEILEKRTLARDEVNLIADFTTLEDFANLVGDFE